MTIEQRELAVSEADLDEGASNLLNLDMEVLVDAALIIGQLDPTEVDTTTMLPRWTDAQRELITKARDQVSEWQDE
jgi:hypothetical protein